MGQDGKRQQFAPSSPALGLLALLVLALLKIDQFVIFVIDRQVLSGLVPVTTQAYFEVGAHWPEEHVKGEPMPLLKQPPTCCLHTPPNMIHKF